MKQFKEFIIEKLIINKNTKVYITKLSQQEQDKIIDELCQYFQCGSSFGGKEYDNRLQIVEKFFHNDIGEYFRRLMLWEDMAEFMNINKNDFKEYVKHNKEELYQTIKDFVL
jgi:hypothetical protein